MKQLRKIVDGRPVLQEMLKTSSSEKENDIGQKLRYT